MKDKTIKVGVSNKEGQLGFVFTRGGLREGSGRKSIGVTKKVSLTLTDEIWEMIEKQCADNEQSRSEVIRTILESYYSN
ncbi:ribbon-helix-helix CopG family protein [Paenibacillus taihuensis]|uniref:Ribbon-helix-helix CopG family protein n=1 Tax=Paenibacillus taihuensis TaxID=1156355 RepID=A0A3D9RHU9_9BACL|nr:CopG family transcriptional regulator [Paenibacillus taihuensis]REE78682.1 ribbon-helix-helix CopG family protein [Paenibacillus taihuensis]